MCYFILSKNLCTKGEAIMFLFAPAGYGFISGGFLISFFTILA